jgi:ribosomal protein S19E (S16A)
MPLTADQLTALKNLNRKEAGEAVDWISISAARQLTELGLAERTAQGWKITNAGRQSLSGQG